MTTLSRSTGQSITRATSTAVNTAVGGSRDASKTWVDANISDHAADGDEPDRDDAHAHDHDRAG